MKWEKIPKSYFNVILYPKGYIYKKKVQDYTYLGIIR